MKPLIVGQAFGADGPGEPLSGKCGRRLAGLCGVDLRFFLAAFDRINLLDFFPGKNGKGDAFPMPLARLAAISMADTILARERVVLLGRNVSTAFGHRAAWFVWEGDPATGGQLLASVPHPSGVSRWWNDPANVASASQFWQALAARSR